MVIYHGKNRQKITLTEHNVDWLGADGPTGPTCEKTDVPEHL